MTLHHIQALQNTYLEYTMYYPTIPKRFKLTRYRQMSSDQRRLSRQPFNPLPSIRGLTPTKGPHPQPPRRSGNQSLAPNDGTGTTTTTCSHQTKSYSTQPAPPTAQIATPKTCPQSNAPDTDGAAAPAALATPSAPVAPPITEKHEKSPVLLPEFGRPASGRRWLGPAPRAGPSPAWEFASSAAPVF